MGRRGWESSKARAETDCGHAYRISRLVGSTTLRPGEGLLVAQICRRACPPSQLRCPGTLPLGNCTRLPLYFIGRESTRCLDAVSCKQTRRGKGRGRELREVMEFLEMY